MQPRRRPDPGGRRARRLPVPTHIANKQYGCSRAGNRAGSGKQTSGRQDSPYYA